MPFDASGRFLPQQSFGPQAAQTQAPSMQRVNESAQMSQPTAAMPQRQPMAINQMAMQQARPQMQNSMAMQQTGAQLSMRPQNYMPMNQNQTQQFRPQNYIPMQNQSFRPQNWMNPMGAPGAPQGGPPQGAPGSNDMGQENMTNPPDVHGTQTQRYGESQLGAPAGYQAPPPQGMPQPQGQQQGPQSVTQSVQNNNPQSTQNFLTALGQAGTGNNNAQMNYGGQMGAGAQGGFMGFQQNGQQAYANPVMAGQAYNPGMGFQRNMASQGPNGSAWNQASQGQYGGGNTDWYGNQAGNAPGADQTGASIAEGGTGGMPGQGQFTTPQPWGNPYNNSDYQWNQMNSDQRSGYLFGTYTPPTDPGQQGGMYSTTGTGQPGVVSDEKAKTNIAPGNKELEEFLDALGVYSYEYKNKEHGEGRHYSTMAQDLEKSKIGKTMVETRPDGIKQVNYGRGFAVMLASNALLNHKYNALETKLKKAIGESLKAKRRVK